MSFTPNRLTVAQGFAKVKQACQQAGLDMTTEVITSKDESVLAALASLEVTNVPEGFVKYQLPVGFDGPTLTYMSHGSPKTKVPSHSHDEGPGIRVILAGSLIWNGKELAAGDWMYIPAGVKYSFDVGPLGVTAFYCYKCCCA